MIRHAWTDETRNYSVCSMYHAYLRRLTMTGGRRATWLSERACRRSPQPRRSSLATCFAREIQPIICFLPRMVTRQQSLTGYVQLLDGGTPLTALPQASRMRGRSSSDTTQPRPVDPGRSLCGGAWIAVDTYRFTTGSSVSIVIHVQSALSSHLTV